MIVAVDWEAWAASDETTRRQCGARSFVERRALCWPRGGPSQRTILAPVARCDRGMLPGMAEWLAARGRP